MDAVYRFASETTFSDYRALLRARQRLGLLRGYGHWLRYPSFAVVFVTTLWWIDGLSAPWSVYLRWDVAKWMVGLVIFIGLLDLFFDRVVGRWVYGRYAAADRLLTASVDGDGISWAVDALSGRVAWSAVKNAVVTADHLFLFIGKQEAVPLSRRGLTEGDWDSVIAFAAARLATPPVRA